MPALNRRAILAGVASLFAVSMPAIAAADPVFAAIEEHRRADAFLGVLLDTADYWGAPEVTAAVEASWRAADRLLNTRPTTVAGVAALLRYLYEFERANPETFCCGPDGSWGKEEGHAWAFLLHGRAAEALEALG